MQFLLGVVDDFLFFFIHLHSLKSSAQMVKLVDTPA